MQRLKELDTLKIIGILLVVLGHVTMVYTSRDVINLGTFPPFMEWITDYIYMFHMPAFVASSGAIYYFGKRIRGKYKDQALFIKGKIQRLLIPYFFFLIFIMLPTRIYIGIEGSIIDFFIKFFFLMIGPHHLWYIIMIFNVYIVFNWFEEKIYRNSFLKVFIVFVLLNFLGGFIPNVFQLGNTLKYLFYFFLGYSFQRYKKQIKIPKSNNVIPLFVLFILSLISFSCIRWSMNNLNEVILYIFQLAGALIGISMLYCLSEYFSSLSFVNHRIIKRISMDSFGIYLFHQGIIYLIVFWSRDWLINPYLFTLLLFIMTIVLSIGFTAAFRKIGWNVLIGESRKQ